MSGKVMWILIVVFVIVFLVGYVVVKRLFFPDYYIDVALAHDFLITDEWKEIPSEGRLIVEKDHQFVAIGVKPPLVAFGLRDGIKLENGDIVNPEVRLVDQDGSEYELVHVGGRRSRDIEFANYEYKKGFPKGRKFEKVMLRSALQIPTARITWSGYDRKDIP